jgi:hypothetical protein
MITDNSHFITQPFPVGLLTVATVTSRQEYPSGTLAGGAIILAERATTTDATVMVIDAGGTLDGGGTAAATRVSLPLSVFGISELTADGITLIRRSLDWAVVADNGHDHG